MPTLVTAAKGQTYSSSFESKSHVLQVLKHMPLLQSGQTPLISEIMTAAGVENFGNSTYYHHEDAYTPDTITATATEAVAQAHIIAANDYPYIQQYDVFVQERTGWVIQITDGTIDANALTCVTVGGVDVGVQINDVFRRLAPAFSEGGSAPSPSMTVEVLKTWYLQKIWRTIEVTKEGELTETYHGSKRNHEVVKKTGQIKREMEMSAWFSAGTADTTANPTHANYLCPATAGIINTLTTNLALDTGVLTLARIRDIANGIRQYHTSGDFTLYAGPKVMGIVDDLIAGKVQVENNVTEYGVAVTKLRLGKNRIRLVEQPMWASEYMGRLAVLVPNPIADFVKLGGLKGYPIAWHKNIKTDDGNDTLKDEIKGWFGIRVVEEPRFGLIDGIIS